MVTSLSVMTFTADRYTANSIGKEPLSIGERALPPQSDIDVFRQLQSATPQLRAASNEDGCHNEAILALLFVAQIVLTGPLDRRKVLSAIGCFELVS
jgi:hypothetical protein